jgi:putative ABC transport system permease protein
MLGIVMGVFSVITIVAIGNAAQAYMNAQFEKLGANIIQITHKSKTYNPNDWLTLKDLEMVKKAVPNVKDVTAQNQVMGGEIRIGSKVRSTNVVGVISNTRNFTVTEMLHGRFITDTDVSSNANVTLVEESFAKKYFGKSEILGETLNIRNINGDYLKVKVVGVTKSEGNMFEDMMGDDYPVILIMPITTVQKFYNLKKLDSINVSVVEKDQLKEIGNRIVKALEFKHGNVDKYVATNTADMQKAMSDILGVISSVLLVIAVITLIVGGIGIVNILLVSVTERIREIGVRKALGAQKKDIIFQFLTESIIMTASSGIIGIILGIVAGSVISSLIKIPPVIDVKVIILSFLGSVALGLIFGVYPAKRAADLDPIESLRYE